MIAFGLVSFLILGNPFSGVWWVFLGWFLLSAARSEEASGLLRQALSGVSVRDVMTPNPVQAPGDISVDEALHGYVLASRHSTFPIHDHDGRLIGLLTMAALKRVPPGSRSSTFISDISCAMDQVPTVASNAPAADLLDRPEGCSEGRTLVVDGDQLVGIVSPSDINRLLRRTLPGQVARNPAKGY
jgi:CBS domain-containing protein